MGRAPLLLPAAALLLAIVAEAHGLAIASMCVAIGVGAFRRDVATAFCFGLLLATLHGHPAVIERERPTARVLGTIVGDVRSEDGFVSFPFAVDGLGTLRATARAHVNAGEQLLVRARITPSDIARNPGEPSARELALDEGVIGEIAVQRILARHTPNLHDPRVWAAVARERGSQAIRAVISEPQATILTGALWGERGSLSHDVHDDFQATGTVHVLVTAGLHLGVIAALTNALFAVFRFPRIRAALTTIPIVFAYAWLSGWHLPSQRAAIMIAIALFARACGARTVSLNTLALAAITVAALWPPAVQSVSFALSFSCVAAIVLLAEPAAERLRSAHVPAPIAEAIGLTLSTQIGVWPLTAAVFTSIAPYALLANAVVVPLIGVAMVLGLGLIAAHPLVPVVAVLARWETWLITLVLWTTHSIAQLPAARLTMPPPTLWAIIVYDALVVAAALIVGKKLFAATSLIAAGCIVVCVSTIFPTRSAFTITALDVGQGDAIVIRTPHRHTLLIDAGGRLERGPSVDGQSPAERSAQRIVIPYLVRAGIRSIDLMILTHPHGDHVGGAAPILRMMPVGRIADSGQRYGGHAYTDALAEARLHHVAVIVPACRQRWIDDEVTFTFLSPCGPQFADGANDVNENSLVVRVEYRNFRALFMGDAGFASEERLLAQGDDLHADLLKVGHHGSAYSSSSAFIKAVHPHIAIISVGRHNLFGHPAAITLETLHSTGTSIFRTDQCGAVTITAAAAEAANTATVTERSMLDCANAPR